ncbi:MAG: flavoredoxin [Desulfobacter postgatei]|uniref:Flavoredoxin n=1 Tax=Desulfobacter postgatei TaxID=2293 RepID=A0A2G6MQP1_9BACT|nr:MAG: flavoredoxin [Desulfobacter postgatei]
MKKSIDPGTYACPAPTWCVGTYDEDGKANIMTIAWGGICCSVPPHLTVSVRKVTYTYAALMRRKCYTVSIPSVANLQEADYFGMASGKDTDKFAISGLTATRSELVDAPYVEEFPLIFECEVKHVVEIGGHVQFVGEIVGIKADENVLNAKDLPAIDKVNPFVYAPTSREYWSLKEVVGQGFSSGRTLMKPS